MLSAKTKLNSIEMLRSKALIDSYVSHEKFISVNVLREHQMKEEIKIAETSVECIL